MAHQLMTADDATLAAFCRAEGRPALGAARRALLWGLAVEAQADYAARAEILLPLLERLSAHMATAHKSAHDVHDAEFWKRQAPHTAQQLFRAIRACDSLHISADLDHAEKADSLRVLLTFFREHGYTARIIRTEYDLFETLATWRRPEQAREHLLRALASARADDDKIMVCQALGSLGSICLRTGAVDSAAVFWDEAYAIAMDSRLPVQAGRILSLYANDHQTMGRLAQAADFFQQAHQVCRELRGGPMQLRFLLDLLNFHATFGFWEPVGHQLRQAKILLRECADISSSHWVRQANLDIRFLEARYLMAGRRVLAADSLYEAIDHDARALYVRQALARFFLLRGTGLLRNDHSERALPILQEGRDHSHAIALPEYEMRFCVSLARAHVNLGHMEAAEEALKAFRDLARQAPAHLQASLSTAWAEHDAMHARILLDRDQRAEARDVLITGLERLAEALSRRRSDARGYVYVAACRELRYAVHDYLANEPAKGHAFDLRWRRLNRILGKYGSREYHTLREELIAPLNADVEGAPATDVFHCQFLLRGDAIICWVLVGGEVRREVLPIAVSSLRRQAARAMEHLARDPGDPDRPMAPELTALLDSLGASLLPGEVADPDWLGAQTLLLLTPDDFLRTLPFEAFGLPRHETYRPLLEEIDVAYLNCADRLETIYPYSEGIVLADPEIHSDLRRRFPSMRRLVKAAGEASWVRAVFPQARFLAGPAATKANLVATWEDVPFLYIAAHFLRDPEAPQATHLPLAAGADEAPLETCLEIHDIRAADLRACDLVVLSGCRNGTPSVAFNSAVPALGDVFLDAGAGAVIHTFWHVRDDRAADLMRRFIVDWGHGADSPIVAAGRARREAARLSDGYRHPFTWAVYSIKLGRWPYEKGRN